MLIAAAAVALVLILGALVVAGLSKNSDQALGPTTTQPDGAKALVEVLRGQGIRVVTTSTLTATKRAATAAGAGGVTVFASDDNGYLDKAQWKTLGTLGQRTVLAAPETVALGALAPGVRERADDLSGTLSPACGVRALAKSATVTGSGPSYEVRSTPANTHETVCLPTGSGSATGGYGLVQLDRGGHTTVVLGAVEALTNGTITDHDNAAMAIGLLGATPTLVWYLPSIADVPQGSQSLAALTPGWVTPSIVLLIAAAVAAGVWRGRRHGPLVVENLPVVVRSTETVEGRARLYQRAGSRLHALDQVRVGALARLSNRLGLGHGSSVDDVVLRVANVLGVDPRRVYGTLVGAIPADDRQLVMMSDDLRDLETALARAMAPDQPRGAGTGDPSHPDRTPPEGTA